MKQMNKVIIVVMIAVVVAIALWQSGTVPQASGEPSLVMSVFDVGQGDAILLTTPNRKHILIDGGPDASVLTRLGETMYFPEKDIDVMIVSHNHADHITGLNRVLERYDVKKVWISGAIYTTNEYIRLLENIKKEQPIIEVVSAGHSLTIDDVNLTVLHPLGRNEGVRPPDQHDATIVVSAEYKNHRILLTGDIDEGHERLMLEENANVKADILKVSHHGSNSGLLPEFLTQVDPDFAVISLSAENSFGHPAPSVIQKLNDANVKTFRTDRDGTVTCTLNTSVVCGGATSQK